MDMNNDDKMNTINKEEFNALKDMKSGNIDLSIDNYIKKFVSLIFYSIIVVFLLTLNFISLSCCLTINKDDKLSGKLLVAVFSFLFGFIYFTIYILGNHIGRKKKTINFDNQDLFPFK
jgi:hypothetical protein